MNRCGEFALASGIPIVASKKRRTPDRTTAVRSACKSLQLLLSGECRRGRRLNRRTVTRRRGSPRIHRPVIIKTKSADTTGHDSSPRNRYIMIVHPRTCINIRDRKQKYEYNSTLDVLELILADNRMDCRNLAIYFQTLDGSGCLDRISRRKPGFSWYFFPIGQPRCRLRRTIGTRRCRNRRKRGILRLTRSESGPIYAILSIPRSVFSSPESNGWFRWGLVLLYSAPV